MTELLGSTTVSIHAPGRGATTGAGDFPPRLPSFNSRTREGCDHQAQDTTKTSATFQFTHPGGVRHQAQDTPKTSRTFQFTHPGGVRPLRAYLAGQYLCVSIHAPGRGATCYHVCKAQGAPRFQFTHPGGVRRLVAQMTLTEIQFQFTHPGGVRLSSYLRRKASPLFQFTHPGGVRHQAQDTPKTSRTFQFTHPGGVRPLRAYLAGQYLCVSIHAPGRGATCYHVCKAQGAPRFQFTHPGGVRRHSPIRSDIASRFQFTHPGGVRHASAVCSPGRT